MNKALYRYNQARKQAHKQAARKARNAKLPFKVVIYRYDDILEKFTVIAVERFEHLEDAIARREQLGGDRAYLDY